MTAETGLPGFPEVATACQHGQPSYTTPCPSNARIDCSRYCKSLSSTHSLVCRALSAALIIQWSSISVAAMWFLSGDMLLVIKQRGFFLPFGHSLSSPATSFLFTHRLFTFKEGLVQFACAEATLTTNACGHGCSICWTYGQVDVCQSC